MERGEIEESLRHISGRTSVYYRNLVTGATIGIREKLPMMAASVIKIPILVEAFHQIRTGEHTKNEIYVLQEGDILESRYAVTRRDRTIHSRMREYLYQITHDERLETVILPFGDGVAASIMRQEL